MPTLTGSLGTVLVDTRVYVPPPPPQVVIQPNVTNVTVAIFPTDVGGHPTGSALATQSVTPLDNGWTVVSFSNPTNVVAGTKYALEVGQGATGTTLWDFLCSQAYGPGNATIFDTSLWKTIFAYDGQDCLASFAFQTYIVVPTASQPTPPPTSTVGSSTGDSPSLPGYLLVLAGLSVAAASAFVVIVSRRRSTQP